MQLIILHISDKWNALRGIIRRAALSQTLLKNNY